jgi:hypothetical protein
MKTQNWNAAAANVTDAAAAASQPMQFINLHVQEHLEGETPPLEQLFQRIEFTLEFDTGLSPQQATPRTSPSDDTWDNCTPCSSVLRIRACPDGSRCPE